MRSCTTCHVLMFWMVTTRIIKLSGVLFRFSLWRSRASLKVRIQTHVFLGTKRSFGGVEPGR